jgi:hypothetical protein
MVMFDAILIELLRWCRPHGTGTVLSVGGRSALTCADGAGSPGASGFGNGESGIDNRWASAIAESRVVRIAFPPHAPHPPRLRASTKRAVLAEVALDEGQLPQCAARPAGEYDRGSQ